MSPAHLVLAGVLAVAATETPNFSGTWKLDPSRSQVSANAALTGLVAAGAPDFLHVTHPRNGALVVESQVNESHARLYTPGAETTTPVYLGSPGSVTVTSRWEDGRFVAEGTREEASGETRVKEVFGLDADGESLKIEITTTASSGTSVSSLTYTRADDVGPCESWPTPCKAPAR